jgi:hypothetical protein
MVFQDEKQRLPIRFLPGIFSIALFLAGCAATSSTAIPHEDPASHGPDLDSHVVVGQGTAEQRAAIDASNQKIFDAEHANSPAATTAPSAPSQTQGGNSQ